MKIHDSSRSIFDGGIEEPSELSEAYSSPRPPTMPPRAVVPAEKKALLLTINEVVPQRQIEAKNAPLSSVQPIPDLTGATTLTTFQNNAGLLTRALNWVRTRQLGRSNTRRLQVAATVSLGEKRFAAVIQIDGLQFLVGGGATNVALLAQLDGKGSFGHLLKENMVTSQERIVAPTAEQLREQA